MKCELECLSTFYHSTFHQIIFCNDKICKVIKKWFQLTHIWRNDHLKRHNLQTKKSSLFTEFMCIINIDNRNIATWYLRRFVVRFNWEFNLKLMLTIKIKVYRIEVRSTRLHVDFSLYRTTAAITQDKKEEKKGRTTKLYFSSVKSPITYFILLFWSRNYFRCCAEIN